LLRAPQYSVTAVVSICLGIGVSTLIFTILNAVFLRPLPYRDPDNLFVVRGGNSSGGQPVTTVSGTDFDNWAGRVTSLDTAAFRMGYTRIETPGGVTRVPQAEVSVGWFHVLGMHAAIGRDLAAADEAGNSQRVVLISDRFWRNRLGGKRDVVGRQLNVGVRSYLICGVLPDRLQFFRLLFHEEPDIIFPITRGNALWRARGAGQYQVIVRLRPGLRRSIAEAELSRAQSITRIANEGQSSAARVALLPLRKAAFGSVDSEVAVLFAAVVLLLLVLWSNLAGLSLARAATRRAEWATRTALGAGLRQIVAALMYESFMIAALGGVGGVGLAHTGLNAFVAVLSRGSALAGLETLTLGRLGHAFAGVAALFSALFVVIPAAAQAARVDTSESLRSRGSAGSLPGMGFLTRKSLIAVQVALVVILVNAAGIMVMNVGRLAKRPLGHEYANAVAVRVALPMRAGYQSAADWAAFVRQVSGFALRFPGVQSVDTVFPITAQLGSHALFTAEGSPGEHPATVQYASVNYLRHMSARVEDGQLFYTDEDCDSSPYPVVVNVTLARQLWPRMPAVGRTFETAEEPRTAFRVVGVVGDLLDTPTESAAPPTIYSCQIQNWNYFVVRTNGDLASAGAAIRAYVHGLSRDIEVGEVSALSELVDASLAPARTQALLVGLFSGAALIISVVGIYGLVSFVCVSRGKEMAIRLAVGAHPNRIRYLAMSDAIGAASAGVAVGAGISAATGPVLRAIMFGAAPATAAVLLPAMALAVLASGVAAYIPANRIANRSASAVLRLD
jgi:putative ABC transport system permease protein